jgi:hypothetical protein
MTIKVGSYVTDMSASGRHYKAVYCVTGESFDQTIVRYVGDVVNGRIEYRRDQPVTYRATENLKEWE